MVAYDQARQRWVCSDLCLGTRDGLFGVWSPSVVSKLRIMNPVTKPLYVSTQLHFEVRWVIPKFSVSDKICNELMWRMPLCLSLPLPRKMAQTFKLNWKSIINKYLSESKSVFRRNQTLSYYTLWRGSAMTLQEKIYAWSNNESHKGWRIFCSVSERLWTSDA